MSEREKIEREREKESREFCAVSPQQETEVISHGNAHEALFPCRSALTIPRTLRSEDASLQVLFRKAGNYTSIGRDVVGFGGSLCSSSC